MGKLLTWTLRTAVKGGLVGGAIYGTAKYGVWDDACRTKQLYEDVKANLPYKEELGLNKVDLSGWKWQSPSDYWNKGVIAVFTWLADSPTHVKHLAGVSWETVAEMTYNLMTMNDPDPHRTEQKS